MLKKAVLVLSSICVLLSFLTSCSGTTNISSELMTIKVVTEYSDDTLVDDIDSVKLGSYPQSDLEGKKKDAIEWIVLEKDEENHKALLLSKYILDSRSYNDVEANSHWEECTLRKWLNETFYNTAFSGGEKKIVLTSNIPNKLDFVEMEGENFLTEDKVFLLSDDDVKKYFGENTEAEGGTGFQFGKKVSTKGTEYAKNSDKLLHKLWVDENEQVETWANGNSSYWLRTSGSDLKLACYVFSDGFLNEFGNYVEALGGGVRPAIWVTY